MVIAPRLNRRAAYFNNKEEAEAYLAELSDFELDEATLRNAAGGEGCYTQTCTCRFEGKKFHIG